MGRATKRDQKTGALLFAGGLVALILSNVLAGRYWPDQGWGGLFLIDVALSAIVIAGAGLGLKGQLCGVAIDPRNRVSLARLQMVLWSVLVLSALACAVTARLRLGVGPEAAAIIGIPGELLAAMGVAATSMVMAPTILSLKPEGSFAASRVAARPNAQKGRFLDILRGDEAGNSDTIDVSKLQQLSITLLVIGIYGLVLYGAFAHVTLLGAAKGWDMPAFGRGFVELMAISHAGYLAYKAAPKPAGAASADAEFGEEVAEAH